MTEVTSSLTTQFSQSYLDLSSNFCCNDSSLKIIRWIGCKPGVYKGKQTMFTSDDLGLCSWYQNVTNYAFITLDFEPGGYTEVSMNGILFMFMKSVWETNAIDSMKHLEIGLNQQGGVIGSMIPFNIETPSPEVYNYTLIRDMYEVNTSMELSGKMRINNPSPYNVSLSILYAY